MESLDSDRVPEFLDYEISHSIHQLKTKKSPGEDRITNDILKAIREPITPILTTIFNEILKQESIPPDWNTAIITLLYKKGDPSQMDNYRPLSMLQTLYKLFTSLILKRISKTLDENQPREQAGFRSGFSTNDHIFTITQIIEKYNEHNKELYVAFVDYSKAFDSISHESLWCSLCEQGVHTKYIKILREIYKNSRAIIKLEKKGEPFSIQKGVRQGDPISPNLFNAVLEHVFRQLNWHDVGIKINGEFLNHLRFADDIVLLSETHTDLECMLKSLDKESRKCGLHMNAEKTCLLTNSMRVPTMIQDTPIAYVDNCIYLGQSISFNRPTEDEVDRRINSAWRRYWSLKEVFKSRIPIRLKKKAMDTIILPTLLYGCQSWTLTKAVTKKLQAFQRAMERSMLGIKLRDRKRSKDIRLCTKIMDAVELACKLKWRWAGHVARATDGRWSERVLHWYPRDVPRTRGRPRRRWCDDIVAVAGPTWTRIAQDREEWHKMEEAFAHKWAPNQ